MDCQHPATQEDQPLSPRPVRVAVYVVLVLVALASVWLIDRRAMISMRELHRENVSHQEPRP